MNRFDPDAIKTQIANLKADRDRIDQTIRALEMALSTAQEVNQPYLTFGPEISLHEAVRRTCLSMIDAITRQRVTATVQRNYPGLTPNPSSVAASLVNLSKGEDSILKVAIEGRGSAPSVYSTEGDIVLRLNAEEIKDLLDDTARRGTGGWQSLWHTLVRSFDRTNGEISLTPELRARIHRYYQNYGGGGWQGRIRRVLNRQMPHLFVV